MEGSRVGRGTVTTSNLIINKKMYIKVDILVSVLFNLSDYLFKNKKIQWALVFFLM